MKLQLTDALAQERLAISNRTSLANFETHPKKKDTDADKTEK